MKKNCKTFIYFFTEKCPGLRKCICFLLSLESFSRELFFQKQANSLQKWCEHKVGASGHCPKVRCVKTSLIFVW